MLKKIRTRLDANNWNGKAIVEQKLAGYNMFQHSIEIPHLYAAKVL